MLILVTRFYWRVAVVDLYFDSPNKLLSRSYIFTTNLLS